MRAVFLVFLVVSCLGAGSPAAMAKAASPYLEDLTWTEVRDAVASGTTTVIIPAGGTEQNGPHMALGKHNARARILAGQIAAVLGDALVAPVIAYVPEGNVSPPTEHMRFPGTISVPAAAFKGTVEGAAQSLRQAGFTHIVLLGDHGGYQELLKSTAQDLNRAWSGTPARAHFIPEYYRASDAAFAKALRAKGFKDSEIGEHAGVADTSLTLALDPGQVRADRLGAPHDAASGTQGDPRRASAELGQVGIDLIVTQTVAAIRKARLEKH
jgi:creatinine amidohydrolase/Fe(II)-dependent formamide hydrolase-like protein